MFGRIVRVAVLLLGVCGVLLAADLPGVWLDVPFVKQEKDGCGAASIAMVMQYWQAQQGQPANDSSDASQIQRNANCCNKTGQASNGNGARPGNGRCWYCLKPNRDVDLNRCLHISFQLCVAG